MTRIHTLKTWPEPFQAILDGKKRYEIRVNDRDFKVGDELHLKEWQHFETGGRPVIDTSVSYPFGATTPTRYTPKIPPHFTGRELTVRVVYMTHGGQWRLPKDVCVMSVEVIP